MEDGAYPVIFIIGWAVLFILMIYKWLTRPVRNRVSHARGEERYYQAEVKGTSSEFWRNLALLWVVCGIAVAVVLCTGAP